MPWIVADIRVGDIQKDHNDYRNQELTRESSQDGRSDKSSRHCRQRGVTTASQSKIKMLKQSKRLAEKSHFESLQAENKRLRAENEELRSEFGKNAKIRYDNEFTIEVMARRTVEVYESAIQDFQGKKD